jgi:hypothetical protein
MPLANPSVIDIRGIVLFFQMFYIDLPTSIVSQPSERGRPRVWLLPPW